MKKYISVVLLVSLAISLSACSDGSHWRGESSAEKKSEAYIEEQIYKDELRRKAYNEGGLDAIHELEGVLHYAYEGLYLTTEDFHALIDNIESWYGEEVAESIRDLMADYAHDSAMDFKDKLNADFNAVRQKYE